MRIRLETSIQHFAGIPPAAEAPAFTPGEDVTERLSIQIESPAIMRTVKVLVAGTNR